jgi:hypothetical protein
MNQRYPRLLFAGLLGGTLSAQSFSDLTESRHAAAPFSKLLQVEAGAIGTAAQDKEPVFGLDDKISWDGSAYYRNEQFTSRRATLEAYAGRDGLFGGFTDGKLIGDNTVTHFEFRARPWMFYRDGFYRDHHLIPTGLFEGSDWEGYAGFGKEAQGLYIEMGPFYRSLDFKRSDLTSVTYAIPQNFHAYGGRIYVEQSTVQMDRRRGLPREGYVATLCGEREWNDSSGAFGTAVFSTELPTAVWRARGRLEWYLPSSDSTVWEVFANGGWADQKDRLQNSEGQRPLGSLWGDAQLRLRIHLGQSFVFTPFVEAQLSKTLEEDGFGSNKDYFLGGGAEMYLHLSEPLSIHGWYSYLNNENRPSVAIDEDVHGQHMFFLGMVLRIGATRH